MKKLFIIIALVALLVVVALKIYLPSINEIGVGDWPVGLTKGSHITTEPLYLVKQSQEVRYGYDFYIVSSIPKGRVLIEKIDLPAKTQIEILDFISIESYGVKGWYAVGSVNLDKENTRTFLAYLHFGYDQPKQVETPWGKRKRGIP